MYKINEGRFKVILGILFIILGVESSHAQIASSTRLVNVGDPAYVSEAYFFNESYSGNASDLGFVDLYLINNERFGSVRVGNEPFDFPEEPISCDCEGASGEPNQSLVAFHTYERFSRYDGYKDGVLFQDYGAVVCAYPITNTLLLGYLTADEERQDCLQRESIVPIQPPLRIVDFVLAKSLIKGKIVIPEGPGPLCLKCPPPSGIASYISERRSFAAKLIPGKIEVIRERLNKLEKKLR